MPVKKKTDTAQEASKPGAQSTEKAKRKSGQRQETAPKTAVETAKTQTVKAASAAKGGAKPASSRKEAPQVKEKPAAKAAKSKEMKTPKEEVNITAKQTKKTEPRKTQAKTAPVVAETPGRKPQASETKAVTEVRAQPKAVKTRQTAKATPTAETPEKTPAKPKAKPAPQQIAAPKNAAPKNTASKTRKAKAAASVAEQPAPERSPEPLILEVPKRQGGRGKKKALPEAPLPEVLSGVEAVPVEADASAASPQVVTRAHVRPLVDMPAHEDDGEIRPASRATNLKSQAQKGRKSKGTKAEISAPVEPEPAEPEATAEETQEASPARDLVVAQLRKLGRPVHVRDLEKTFTRTMLSRVGNWRDLAELLESLVESGAVIRTRKKTYGLPEAMSLVRGRFQASAAGFGFVIPDSGGEDYYIPAEQTLEAWNGDIVLVRMEGRGDTGNRGGPRRGQRGDGNPRASVVRIVQRAYKQLVGTLEFHHGHPILRPDDHRARHRILLLPEGLEGLAAGARVVTELFWPENTGEDEVFGQITRTLGAEDDPATETEAVIVKFGLRGEFPPEVVTEANAIPSQIPDSALKGRLDLRSFNIFTVDGRDAKDFDDAIHIQPTPEGTFVVGIHIADVSHYVREDTPLDEEAYARATSVYLPGRVLPMLPEHLSNGVCSLVPYEDRLTMTALVELNAEGDILKVQLAPSVINSKARLTYDEVQAYSEATATLPESARHLEGDLHLLLKITSKLRQKRLREGSLDFKLREVKVDVGKDGRMELIPIREETARGMIEDLMLLANKVVAHYLIEREIPALFRIHEEPTLQRFQDVSSAIGRLGLAFPGGEPTPQAYQAVLKQVRGTNRESVVNTLLLRSMQQAKYAGENLGHFGLAFDEYLHFTSPIRRYPDLLVHRVLKGVLAGDLKAHSRDVAVLQGKLPGMGDHTSDRERTAAEAERDLTKYYQCKWAQEHLGESFAGNVSGVTASGLYVALDNGVEGKLHISHLDDDYYVFIEDAQILKGRSRGKSYRLGDPVNITISAVKPLARQIDLTLADPTDPEYKLGKLEDDQQENHMEGTVKVRARRREDREQERQEKLKTVQVSAPKKFTLDDPEPIRSSAPTPARQGSRGRNPNNGGPSNAGGRGQQNQQRGRTFGGVPVDAPRDGAQRDQTPRESNRTVTPAGGRNPRRVITLERPRNEHLRPVNITVQRMYFGDWTLDNMPPEEPQGRSGGRNYSERGNAERGGRGYSRGSNDRGAVQRVNGRPTQQQQTQQPTTRPALAQAATPTSQATAQPSSTDEANKRRRRRRGRRPGTGNSGNES